MIILLSTCTFYVKANNCAQTWLAMWTNKKQKLNMYPYYYIYFMEINTVWQDALQGNKAVKLSVPKEI